MHRCVRAMALTALFIPAAAAAQLQPLQEDIAGPQFRITPFVGHLTAFERIEEWRYTGGADPSAVSVAHEVAGGTALGVNVDVPINARFGVTAAGAYAARDASILALNTGEMFQIDGNNVFLARLGAVLHLREDPSDFVLRRLAASVFAGAAVMHERPRNSLGTADFAANGTHFGANLGVNAEIPFAADRFALQLGIEDNMMWWRDTQVLSIASEYFGSPAAETIVSADMTHSWLVRAGITMRLR